MRDLSIKAKLFILVSILLGIGLSTWQFSSLTWQDPWLIGLAVAAAAGQVFKVHGSTERSNYNVSWIVYAFTFFYLGTPEALFVIIFAHVVEWIWHKYPWYIQAFNISTYALAISIIGQLSVWIMPTGLEPVDQFWAVLAILVMMAAFTVVNHFLVGMVIKLARGQGFSQSGVFGLLTLMIDFSMLGLGSAAALVASTNIFGVVISILPLYLIYSTLKVPALQRQTEIDPKTKLYNARYFADELEKELTRAERFDRPMTLVMADLDLLRNINNTYGHLAGDVVLIGVAEILQKFARDYDVVARFGGEEFSILMPETAVEDAYPMVEVMRQAVESAEFEVSTSVTPIKVTMSFGVTGRDTFGQSMTDIIHNADMALYHSKLSGRNLTTVYAMDGISDVFDGAALDAPKPDKAALQSRIEISQQRFRPNPVREVQGTEVSAPANNSTQSKTDPVSEPVQVPPRPAPAATEPPPKPADKKITKQTKPWMINAYIFGLSLIALVLFMLILPHRTIVGWFGITAFAIITILTEALSIEIYVRGNSISTSAAPVLAGTLLFGPFGALLLSLVLAGTAMIKNRSQLQRLFFNSSNHLISYSLAFGLVGLAGGDITGIPTLGNLGINVAAGFLNYLVSTLMVAGAIAISSGGNVQHIWKERFRWLWPYYLAYGVVSFAFVIGYDTNGILGVLAVLVPLLILRFSQVQYIDHTKKIVQQLRQQNTVLEEHTSEITILNEELLLALAHMVDLRDPFVYGHSQHVARYASSIAKELGLAEERLELIRKAGLLHDVGKMGISEEILFKPGPLTQEEYEVVKTHTILGAEIIDSVHSLRTLTPIIRYHHERFDGNGYPDGLSGQDIPLEARIMGLSDALEAMASDRPYRKALTFDAILSEITTNAGTQFDPAVVDAFMKVLEREGRDILVNSAVLMKTQEGAPFNSIHVEEKMQVPGD